MRISLVILALLAACGGGTVAVVIATPPQPRASEPAASAPAVQAPAASAPDAAASAPEPAASTPAASPSWAMLLMREPWERLTVGGWIRREQHPPCPDSGADPGSFAETAFGAPAAGWAPVGNVVAGVSDGHLLIDQVQTGGGWALLHSTLLDHTRPLRVAGQQPMPLGFSRQVLSTRAVRTSKIWTSPAVVGISRVPGTVIHPPPKFASAA